MITTPDEIRETLFDADSKTEALIAEYEGKIAGCAVFFTSYLTRAWPQRYLYGRPVCIPGLSRKREEPC